MRKLLSFLVCFYSTLLVAGTPPPGILEIKGATDGTAIGNIGDSLKVVAPSGIPITAPSGLTVSQGDAASPSGAWPIYLCDSSGTHCMAVNADGSVNTHVTNSSLAVTGTFWQATQPISAVNLPLPTNAAQETGGHLASIDSKLTNPLPISGAVTVLNFPSPTPTQTVTGTVNIGTFPSPLPVIGTVTVSNLPSPTPTQTVTGTVNIGTFPSPLPVTVLNFPSPTPTQTVTGIVAISSLPSPVPVIGTVAVSNFPSPTPTQTVTGTVAISSLPSPVPVTGSVAITSFPSPLPVTGTVNIGTFPSPLPVTITSPTGFAQDTTVSGLQVSQGSTTSGQKGGLVLGAVTTDVPAYTTGQTSPISLNLRGGLRTKVTGLDTAELIRNDYSSNNVTTAAYFQLVASTSVVINRMYIFDSSGQDFVLATGGSGSEVDQIEISPGGWDAPVDLYIASGTRLSIKSKSATANAGILLITGLK